MTSNSPWIIGLIAGRSGKTLINRLKEKGLDVALICGDESDSGFNLATYSKAIKFTPISYKTQVEEAIHFFKNKNIHGLILGTGTWFALEILKFFAKENLPVSHHPDSTFLFKDKYKTKSIFQKKGMKTPNGYLIYNMRDLFDANIEILGGVVVKSNIDLFPVSCFYSQKKLVDFLSSIEDGIFKKGILLETFVHGNDATVPLFVSKNEDINFQKIIYWSKQYNYKLKGFGELENYKLNNMQKDEIKKEVFEFIKSTNYYGVCRFDIRVAKDTYYYLEVNSVVSIRDEGSSYKSFKKEGILLDTLAIDAYLENLGIGEK